MTKRVANNATTWALSVFESDMPPAQKLICLYLRTHMNDYRDVAWPSVGRIAEKCSLSVRSVQGHLKKIQDSGYLMINGYGPNGTHRYAISTPAESAPRRNCATPPQKTTYPPAESAPELTKELNKELTNGKLKSKPMSDKSDDCLEIFEYWITVMGKNRSRVKFTPERKNKIKQRLKVYSVEQIKRGIDGCRKSGYHMGRNDSNTEYNDIELICRNDTKLETFINGSGASATKEEFYV